MDAWRRVSEAGWRGKIKLLTRPKSIFRKPTDYNTILRADSFHPPWLIFLLVNSKEFQRDMNQRFRARGYQHKLYSEHTTKKNVSLENNCWSLNRENNSQIKCILWHNIATMQIKLNRLLKEIGTFWKAIVLSEKLFQSFQLLASEKLQPGLIN